MAHEEVSRFDPFYGAKDDEHFFALSVPNSRFCIFAVITLCSIIYLFYIFLISMKYLKLLSQITNHSKRVTTVKYTQSKRHFLGTKRTSCPKKRTASGEQKASEQGSLCNFSATKCPRSHHSPTPLSLMALARWIVWEQHAKKDVVA